jgi:hypothetical protein
MAKDRREGQAHLWPFYLAHEFLARSTDTGSYCYLTDGGHFDNTGLYALVERGCRYVIVLDVGAELRRKSSKMFFPST